MDSIKYLCLFPTTPHQHRWEQKYSSKSEGYATIYYGYIIAYIFQRSIPLYIRHTLEIYIKCESIKPQINVLISQCLKL